MIAGRGPDTGGEYVILSSFEGVTTDGSWLTATPDPPWQGIDSIRVATIRGPASVAWYEIEVYGTLDG